MPLSRLDEYLTHQFPEPVDTVYTADRNFYDRYYFNLYGPGDELFLVAGLGQYPNLGVTDAFVTIAHDQVQTTVRASRELGSDRLDTSVGPIRVEVVEGLRSLRLVCEPNEWGVAYDLRFDATTEALAEPKTISRAGTRVTQDTFRYAQVGAWTGTLEVGGTTYDVTPDTWRGARDRSWGVRPVGEPEPKGIQAKFDPSGSMGFLHNWLPIQFDDHMIKITIDNDHAGRRVQEEAMLLWSLGSDRPDEHLGRPEIDIEYHPGTREVRQGTIWFSGDGASSLRITATPLRTVYLKSGSGYHWDGTWGHGVWQGAETRVEGLVDPIGAPTERHHLAWLNETLSRFETNDGRVGHGMWENLCMGLYLPAGFDRPDAVAPLTGVVEPTPTGETGAMAASDILRLEPHGVDTYVGSGPQYPWGGLYGGQIVAQALRAAILSLGDGPSVPHSLRAYFIRPGDHDEPVRYEVDRLRNGTSFTTRRVVARQAIGAILNLEASFTVPAHGPSRTRLPMPDVPGPDAGRDDAWTDLFERRVLPYTHGSGEVFEWLRLRENVGDHGAAAFAFLSDDVPTDAVRSLLLEPGGSLEEFDETWFMVSLDHTVWFHDRVDPDEWHLHAFTCDRVVGDRGLTHGRVYAANGRHVATIAQEVLVRRRRD